jgi:hypothetical protein
VLSGFVTAELNMPLCVSGSLSYIKTQQSFIGNISLSTEVHFFNPVLNLDVFSHLASFYERTRNV